MKILVINCGSSSLKYQLIDMETEKVMASGKYERIGEKDSFLTHKVNGKKYVLENMALDHSVALEFSLNQLVHPEYGVISNLDEIDAVGNRIVHGGENIKESVIIDEKVKGWLQDCADLAPLHNPAALAGIKALEEVIPGKPMTVVVDTAFHQTMPKEKYLYPIPYKYYEKYGVRKYGFHGTSHMYVSRRLAEIENKNVEDLKIVTCHLGQGSSICAIKNGKSIDTSMGLTPLGGLPMVTRCGDIDPSVILYIMRKENIDASTMESLLNKNAGVVSMAEKGNLQPDFRSVEIAARAGDEGALLAFETFESAVAQYIARYAVDLGGIDYIVFTGGIGENQGIIREGICKRLGFMGIELDENKNNLPSQEMKISKDSSKVKVFVVPTNEELMIAKETARLINK